MWTTDSIEQMSAIETVRVSEKPTFILWGYDEKTDVLYLSVGESRPVIDMDIHDGMIVCYDGILREIAGLKVIGMRARLLKGLAGSH